MTIPASHADMLDKPVFWHIATTGPNGELQTSPVWGGRAGDNFVFSLTTGRQKYKNLQANPVVAISGIDNDNGYRYLEMRGRVIRVDQDPDLAFIDSMAKKYLDMDAYPNHQEGDVRVVMVVGIEKTTSKS